MKQLQKIFRIIWISLLIFCLIWGGLILYGKLEIYQIIPEIVSFGVMICFGMMDSQITREKRKVATDNEERGKKEQEMFEAYRSFQSIKTIALIITITAFIILIYIKKGIY